MNISNLTYSEAKAISKDLDRISQSLSEELNNFEKNEMGLTPDHVKSNPEFIKAKIKYDLVFKQLRNFNSQYTKIFKKELAEDRKTRYSKLAKN